MAIVFRIANSAQTDLFDFQTAYLRPMLGSWRTTYPGNGTAIDTMLLIAKNTTDANAMTAALQLSEMCDKVRRYVANPLIDEAIWVELNANTETAKRALIVGMELVSEPFGAFTAMLGKNASAYQLTITRMALFESYTAYGFGPADANGISCLGGAYTVAAIPGSAPARISDIRFRGHNGGGGPIDRLWCGIRPALEGVSSFNPLWELENGTTGFIVENDADASPAGGGNNSIRCALTTTNAQMVSMTVDQACADSNYAHFVGEYLVLLRYKLGAAGTAVIQGRYGFTGNATFAAMNSNPTAVTNTDFRYMQLGTVSVPPFGYRSSFQGSTYVQNFQLQVWAYRIGAAVNLILDCLVLIPYPCITISEGSAILYTGAPTNDFTETRHAVSEDGKKVFCYLDLDSTPNSNLVGYLDLNDWQLPVEGGVLVLAGERTASQVFTDHINLDYTLQYRYRVFGEST